MLQKCGVTLSLNSWDDNGHDRCVCVCVCVCVLRHRTTFWLLAFGFWLGLRYIEQTDKVTFDEIRPKGNIPTFFFFFFFLVLNLGMIQNETWNGSTM